MRPRSEYENPERGISGTEQLARLGPLQKTIDQLDKEYEGTKGELKTIREKQDAIRTQIGEIGRAQNTGAKVYMLKDGTVTSDKPDPQMSLVDPDDLDADGEEGEEAATG